MNLGDLEALRLHADDALFLDFDGTLAEIGPDPDDIWLPDMTHKSLAALGQHLGGAVAILSGRDLRDLARRTPASVWRLGGHGLETIKPGEAPPVSASGPPVALLSALDAAARQPGVRLEIKGPVVAIHYRAAPEEERTCLAVAQVAAQAAPGYVVQAGKMVVEVKPAGAHKGAALRNLMNMAPFAGRRAIMLGDDTTDEDAMSAAIAVGGTAIKIGAGESAASWRAPDPEAVREWLAREALTADHVLR